MKPRTHAYLAMNILVLEGCVGRDGDSILGRMFFDLFLGRWKRHWLHGYRCVLIIYVML